MKAKITYLAIAALILINSTKAQEKEEIKSIFNTPQVKYAISDLYFYTNNYLKSASEKIVL